MTRRRAAEAAGTALAGGALGAAAGSLVGLAVPVAAVAGLNGVVSGWRGIYRWRSANGPIAFVLDSTWAAATTAAGLVAHLGGVVRGNAGYVAELSERQNRHVYARGLQFRRGFAITFGNVVSGAGDVRGHAGRVRLVTDHEDVHVWQSRWFGPAFPVTYGGWMLGGALAGVPVWFLRHRDQRCAKVVESCAYYLNPFEWWAYSRGGRWPPTGLVAGLGWRRAVVRSFASFRDAG